MIEVKYWPRELRLTVSGHALEEAQEVNPEVCCAASMLMFALMNQMHGFVSRRWAKDAVYFDTGSGFAYVRMIKPKWHKFKAIRVAFGLVYGGLCMLAEKYPKAIRCDVCTGEPFNDAECIKNASLTGE